MQNLQDKVIAGCIAKATDNLFPCIKQQVYAMIITAAGNEYFGSNWMTNSDVSVCPRVTNACVSGTGYELCKSDCNQLFHAERFAIAECLDADDTAVNSTLYLVGHTYCCDHCIAAMKAAGIKHVYVLNTTKEYHF